MIKLNVYYYFFLFFIDLLKHRIPEKQKTEYSDVYIIYLFYLYV